MLFPRLIFLLAGMAAGALTKRREPRETEAPGLRRSLDNLAGEMKSLAAAHEARLARLEARVEDHEARLKETPSAAQIVSAMDGLLAKAMSGVDRRLIAQEQSIAVLQEAVSQTDRLLERVLESLDTLREDPPVGASRRG
jgi:chromosome segregation ATPase